MPRKSSVKTGDVVYIKNPEVVPDVPPPVPPPPSPPAPEPVPEPVSTIAPTTLQKQKVKKPLSDAKKEHLAKLAEANRKKREEARLAKSPPPVDVPEPPGDTVRATVRPKRQYKKKDKDFWEVITEKAEKRKELDDLPSSKNEIIYPVVEVAPPKPKPKPKPFKAREVDMPPPLKLKRQPKYYRKPISESEEESEESEESESEEEIERVVRKTHKRISTLQKIDERLKTLQNPYAVRGLSVF